ncbi:PKD domain-containing protein [bacterium]|nr:PKD domain-containing protein [bacterium]
MVSAPSRRSLYLYALGCVIAMLGQPSARAYYLQLPDTTGTLTSGNRVQLSARDPEDQTTHTWTSDKYTAVSNLSSNAGIVAWLDEDRGLVHMHAGAYDPGDRKFHIYQSRVSSSFTSLTVSGGIVSVADDFWGAVIAAAYDPGERHWNEWESPGYGDVTSVTNTGGVVAFLADSSNFVIGAAYDAVRHKWRIMQQGPDTMSDLTNSGGVLAFLCHNRVFAEAYDSVDREWHGWFNFWGTDENLAHTGTVVAFTRGTTIYALAYDPGDHEWDTWQNSTGGTISGVSISKGVVSYTYSGSTYNHFMSRKPNASFVAVPSSRADSMYVGFAENSCGDVTSYRWSFGDTYTSTRRSPNHVYKKIGDYVVALQVTGYGGSDATTEDVSITTPTYTLDYAAGPNGTIAGATHQLVKYGGNGATVTAVANTGYHFLAWSDGLLTSARLDTSITANLSVTALFAINVYSVSFRTDGTLGASVTGTSPQSVNYGASCTSVKANAPAGWQFAKWTNSGATYSTANPITVGSVKSDLSLTANFNCTTAAGNWEWYQ